MKVVFTFNDAKKIDQTQKNLFDFEFLDQLEYISLLET